MADREELLRVRVLPAEFARLMGVSKQSVSRWVKAGWLTVDPISGRIDTQRGIGQVLRNVDPGRLRARWIGQAITDVQELRRVAAEAEERQRDLQEQLLAAKEEASRNLAWAEAAELCYSKFFVLLGEREGELRHTTGSVGWRLVLEKLDSQAAGLAPDDDDEVDDVLEAEPSAEDRALMDTVNSELDGVDCSALGISQEGGRASED